MAVFATVFVSCGGGARSASTDLAVTLPSDRSYRAARYGFAGSDIIDIYAISLTDSTRHTETKTGSPSETVVFEDIPVGPCTVEVFAYDSDNTPIAYGKTTATVVADEETAVTISLSNSILMENISTVSQFIIALGVANTPQGKGLNISLGADIDLSAMSEAILLGRNSDNAYSGTFDGKGHSITVGNNNYGSYYDDESLAASTGLCLYNNGTIKDLTVRGSLTSQGYSNCSIFGGIAIYNNGTISGCVNEINYTASSSFKPLGGIAHKNTASGVITNCTNRGNLISNGLGPGLDSDYGGYELVGAIAGFNSGSVSNCTNTGSLQSALSNRTGMIGESNGGTISGCSPNNSIAFANP